MLLFCQISFGQLVWPGDVNNNGIVNGTDLVVLGTLIGETGPRRTNASIEWIGQEFEGKWNDTLPNGLNLAFADCNGDGIINVEDAQVIEANFNRMHGDVIFVPDEIPPGVAGASPAFSVLSKDLSFNPLDKKVIEIGLGDLDIPVDSISGISFMIKLDPQHFNIAETDFQFAGWLDNETSYSIKKLDSGTNKSATGDFIVSYTSTNGEPISGSGLMGSIILSPSITELDVIALSVILDSILMMDFDFNVIPVLGLEINLGLADSLLVSNTSISATMCEGDTIIFNNQALSNTGVYLDTLTNQYNRDSFIVLILAVEDTAQTVLNTRICEGAGLFFNGQMLTDSGTYRDTLSTSSGCDSFIVVNLTIDPAYQTMLSETICEGESFFFNNNNLMTTGIYEDTLKAMSGCDSMVTLNLTVGTIENTLIEETICDGETSQFNNQILSTSGVYMDTLSTSFGCDSFIQYNLTVLDNYETSIDTIVCPGDTVVFLNFILTTETTYWTTFTAANGCDSSVVLHLMFDNVTVTNLEADLCPGDSLSFNGQILTASGIYTDTLTSAIGCDSIIQLDLTMKSSCQSVSIEETFLENINIYPNPARDYLFIHSRDLSISSIQVVNMTGQIMQEQYFSSGTQRNSHELNLNELVSGIYWVLIQTEYGVRQELISKL